MPPPPEKSVETPSGTFGSGASPPYSGAASGRIGASKRGALFTMHVRRRRGRRSVGRAQRPRVVLVTRLPLEGYYSIENAFAVLVPHLSSHYDVELSVLPRPSIGLVNRLVNMVHCARLDADVVHITGDVHYCALAVRRRKILLTIHDCRSLYRLSGARRAVVDVFWFRLPLAWSQRVTAISSATQQDILSFYPWVKTKITVVPNAATLPRSSPDPSPGDRRTTPFRVLQIGTGANKNLERVVSAVKGLPVHLRIIGRLTEPQLELLAACGTEFSAAEGLDEVELANEYRRADMVVFVSTYEGFGLPIVEAQAAGVPLVTSKTMPMADVAGLGAVLADPHDTASIRRAIKSLLGDPTARAEVARLGLVNVERFAPEAIAQQYASLYDEALDQAGCGAARC